MTRIETETILTDGSDLHYLAVVSGVPIDPDPSVGYRGDWDDLGVTVTQIQVQVEGYYVDDGLPWRHEGRKHPPVSARWFPIDVWIPHYLEDVASRLLDDPAVEPQIVEALNDALERQEQEQTV